MPSIWTRSTSPLNKELNEALLRRKAKRRDYLLPNSRDLPYIVLDQRAFKKAGVDEKTAEEAVALPVARSRWSTLDPISNHVTTAAFYPATPPTVGSTI